MTHKLVTHALSLLLGTVLAGSAIGQSNQNSQQQDKQSQGQGQQGQGQQGSQAASGATKKAGPAGVIPLGVTVEERALVLEGWRASKLLGADVYNDKNERIGKIEDMLVSPDGKLSVAVIEVGGFLGIGKRRVAIPVDQFSDITAQRLVLPGATRQALKELPEFLYT